MGFRHGPESEHMMGYGNFSVLWIVITGLLLLIIWFLVYKLVQKNKHFGTDVENNNKALNILKERYALGELTDEEFTNKKEMLNNKNK